MDREERRRERIGSCRGCRGTRQGGEQRSLRATRRSALEQREPKEKRLNDGKGTKAALVTTICSKGERRSNALRVGGGEGGTGTNERREGVACFVERGDGKKRREQEERGSDGTRPPEGKREGDGAERLGREVGREGKGLGRVGYLGETKSQEQESERPSPCLGLQRVSDSRARDPGTESRGQGASKGSQGNAQPVELASGNQQGFGHHFGTIFWVVVVELQGVVPV